MSKLSIRAIHYTDRRTCGRIDGRKDERTDPNNRKAIVFKKYTIQIDSTIIN